MYNFKVSAPGRVHLCGNPLRYEEHCIAASLDMRTRLEFSSILPSEYPYTIEINFSDIQLNMTIILRTCFLCLGDMKLVGELTDAELYTEVENFVSSLREYTGTYEPNNLAHRLSLETFFFLLVYISRKNNMKITSSFRVTISTELAIGEGLGSSVSFVACLAACFYLLSLLQKGVVIAEFDHQDISNIFQYVRTCNYTIYHCLTTVDSYVSLYGSVRMFESDAHIGIYGEIPNMKILLVSSNVCQKTLTEQNERMRNSCHSHLYVESIQKCIDDVVGASNDILETMEYQLVELRKAITCYSDENEFRTISKEVYIKLLGPSTLEVNSKKRSFRHCYYIELICWELCSSLNTYTLQNLVNVNQGLLHTLDMSHPNLDAICAIAQQFSLAGKLTGNGGGGYAFILLLPDSTDELISEVLDKLKSHNFSAKLTSINCPGVTID
ncbi:PREDICTED: mevalonate kinase-like [Vollenhovia emeryi]|uniref:mevalonate kinase-like n=1 Tax=Vollenhovia emeryi TaxID=411798 RepID=UPI0005F54AF8|nr:PREDICTED: mevalonate kinase-like [Vollenhovia emeryi]